MGFFSAIKNGFIGIKNRLANSAAGVKVMKLMTDEGDTGYFSFDGKLYHSDVVVGCQTLCFGGGEGCGKAYPSYRKRKRR